MRVSILALSIFFLVSCSTQKKVALNEKRSSVFANANELGSNKASFILKYGEPINKDLKKEGNDIVESLYYLEDIQGVMVTTKIKFVNDNLVEQSNYKMDALEKTIKELKEQVETNNFRILMKK